MRPQRDLHGRPWPEKLGTYHRASCEGLAADERSERAVPHERGVRSTKGPRESADEAGRDQSPHESNDDDECDTLPQEGAA